jgi:hypothetical protein
LLGHNAVPEDVEPIRAIDHPAGQPISASTNAGFNRRRRPTCGEVGSPAGFIVWAWGPRQSLPPDFQSRARSVFHFPTIVWCRALSPGVQ